MDERKKAEASMREAFNYPKPEKPQDKGPSFWDKLSDWWTEDKKASEKYKYINQK